MDNSDLERRPTLEWLSARSAEEIRKMQKPVEFECLKDMDRQEVEKLIRSQKETFYT